MLAQDAHASFVEAVRRKQIRSKEPAALRRILSENLVNGPGAPVGAYPVIDLSAVFRLPRDAGDVLYDAGEAATVDGTLPAPFFEWLALTPAEPGLFEGGWWCTMVEMQPTLWVGNPFLYSPKAGYWVKGGGSWTLPVPSPERRIEVVPMPGYSDAEAQAAAHHSFMQVIMGCAALARPGVAAEPDAEAPDTPLRRSVNQGREKGRLPPLPMVRVLDLSKACDRGLRERAEGAGGWTIRGHDRRGHNRTLPSGRVVAVRPALVKGGALRGRITEIKL